jgi:hypothetical protein
MIHFSQMPESFTGQALYYAARNPYLNPKVPLPALSRINNRIRNFLRFGFVFCTGLLAAPAGAVYHAAWALRYRVFACKTNNLSERERRITMAWEHLKASGTDVCGISCLFALRNIFNSHIPLWFSSSDVYVPETKEIEGTEHLVLIPNYSREIKGILAYKFIGCQVYPYALLKFGSERFFELKGKKVDINHKQILRYICRTCEFEPSSKLPFLLATPSQKRRYLKLEPGQLTFPYKTSWKAVALVICSIAVFIVNTAITIKIKDNLFNQFILNGFALFLCLKILGKARDESYQLKEKERQVVDEQIVAGNLKETLHWYERAALDGHNEAQRVYGLSLINSLAFHQNILSMDEEEVMRLNEGLRWLQAAIYNGNLDAVADMILLIPSIQNNVNIEFKQTQHERLRLLFGDRNFLTMAMRRFTSIFQMSPEALDKYRNNLLKSDGRLLALDNALNLSENGSNINVPQGILGLIAQYM